MLIIYGGATAMPILNTIAEVLNRERVSVTLGSRLEDLTVVTVKFPSSLTILN